MNITESVENAVKERLESDTKSLEEFKSFAKSILGKDEWGYLKHSKEISNNLHYWGTKILREIDYKIVICTELDETASLIAEVKKAWSKYPESSKLWKSTPYSAVRELWNSSLTSKLVKPFTDLINLIKTDCYSPEGEDVLFDRAQIYHNKLFYPMSKLREAAMYLNGFADTSKYSCQIPLRIQMYIFDSILDEDWYLQAIEIEEEPEDCDFSSVGDSLMMYLNQDFWLT